MGCYDQRREKRGSKAKQLARRTLRKMRFGLTDITSVFGEPIGEFMRKGVLAGDMSNGMLQRLLRCLAGVLAAQ